VLILSIFYLEVFFHLGTVTLSEYYQNLTPSFNHGNECNFENGPHYVCLFYFEHLKSFLLSLIKHVLGYQTLFTSGSVFAFTYFSSILMFKNCFHLSDHKILGMTDPLPLQISLMKDVVCGSLVG
jgi:hypothetical protein